MSLKKKSFFLNSLTISFMLQTIFSHLAVANSDESMTSTEKIISQFTSPNQLTEQCTAIAKLPMGHYKQKDLNDEKELCSLNFYNNSVALCPKTWSTSPGTIILDIKDKAATSEEAEKIHCKKATALDDFGKFKQTMNQVDTSGTFSGSSIIYYHLSRALDTTLGIPVAVHRTMDREQHLKRVSLKATPPANARMNIAGWNWIKSAETAPQSYNSSMDFFADAEKKLIYGTLVNDSGARYGAEINGPMNGNLKENNFSAQKTPAFMALKNPSNLLKAIEEGVEHSLRDPNMAKAFISGKPSQEQMVLWMNEMSEMAILDFIMSQQDRIGNIDYKWYWSYVDENGDVKSVKVSDDKQKKLSRLSMNKITVPQELINKKPILVQKTLIGDNDAGGLVQYSNLAKSTGMLDGVNGINSAMAHINPDTYQRLLKLADDFSKKAANFTTLNNEVRLLGYKDKDDRRFRQLIGNTILAAQILQKNCKSGILKLDLVSFKQAMKRNFNAETTSCDIQ